MGRTKPERRPSQHRGEVKSETVNTHVLVPINQAVDHQGLNPRVIGVYRVTTTGVIDIVAGVFRVCSVIGQVINTAKGKCGTAPATLTCMVVNHIQYDLDTGFMNGIHHLPELKTGIP